ncbi:MAG: hypothetical protein HY869_04975 [Chloroflexi bacterium]|nr:hypothetical protein [Chloroflexota bacterium]
MNTSPLKECYNFRQRGCNRRFAQDPRGKGSKLFLQAQPWKGAYMANKEQGKGKDKDKKKKKKKEPAKKK